MNNDLYKNLFENCQSVMLIIHPDTGAILDANSAACRFYGYKKQELVDMSISNINILSREDLFSAMKNASTENQHHFNFRHQLANGDIRDVEVFCGPITIDQKTVLYSIVHDISERKRIEKEIEAERQFSNSLINSLPGVMYVFDQLGHFKRWNKNLETLTGYSPKLISRMNPLDFIATEDRAKVKKEIENVFEKGSGSVEANFVTIDGKVIPHLLTGYRLVDEPLSYLVGIGIDLSDRINSKKEKEKLIAILQETLSQVKQLSGFLPICASCKNIRDDKGYWNQIECYIREHSEAEFSHGICPDCAKKLYPNLIIDD